MCKVLIADDSEVMRTAIRRTLEEEQKIHVVGEACSFADAMQKIADLKPDVLLLDLHLPEKREFAPALVNSKALAESYGAVTLRDKMSLYTQMVPAILQCESKGSNIASLLRKPFKRRAHAA